jgi:dTDP-glucose 4,6-dehydratase
VSLGGSKEVLNYSGKKVLVTGAGGFIASHLIERLVQLDAAVRCFVRYTSCGSIGHLANLREEIRAELEIVFGDLQDAEAVSQAVAGVDVIFHLGALIAIPYSYVHPQEVSQSNIFGTLNVLTAVRRSARATVVHTSTSEVYGTAQYIPIDEKHALQAQSPYAASKIAADKLAQSFHLSFGLPIVVVRPFNTYGPRQSDRAVIPTIISQALSCREIVLGALEPTRDFTFVTDTVQGFLAAALAPTAVGQEINLGSNTEITVGDLCQLIIALLGKADVAVRIDPARLRPERSEVLQLRADNSKAKQLLDWCPRISLTDGLLQTIAWVTAHPDSFTPSMYRL